MGLFDKVGDISQFDWQKKIGRTNETNTDNLPPNTTANKKLKDQDWEGQHDKFGGNKGLRTGNLGFDEPFIVKEIGNRDVTAGFDEGLMRGGTVFNTLRGVTDTARLAKFQLTGRGIVFNLKQFLLQQLSHKLRLLFSFLFSFMETYWVKILNFCLSKACHRIPTMDYMPT